MTCLINIVTSLLLVSGTAAGTVQELDSNPAPTLPTSPIVQSRVIDDPFVDDKDEAKAVLAVSQERPPLELIGLSTDQAETVQRAVGLFDEAGLQLPALVVRGDQGGSRCGQHLGLHRQHESWSEILLCTSGLERSVVVHELAHAWAAFELSDANKAAFQQVRGWVYWRDYQRAAWRDNGTEQAAEVIAWGVYDLAAPIAIDLHGCDDLVDSYRALTGIDPVQGLTTLCEPATASVFS